MCEKGHIWNPATFCYENERYAKSIIDDSIVKCDEITEKKKYFDKNCFSKIYSKES